MAGNDLVTDPVTHLLSLFLVQVVVILVLVRILAKLLAKVNQPPVIGEIIAGVLLGPSVLGFIPNFSDKIFPVKPSSSAALTVTASSADVLDIFAQVGLIFFMFFLGLEVDPILLTRSWKSATPIAIASILCPFAIGAGFSFYLIDIEPTTSTQVTFLLFMGTCLSFTAFPVLARILTSFQLIDRAFGLQCLSIAAIDDVLAWCTLAITLSYAGGGSAIQGLYTMLITAAFVLVLVFIIRPFLVWIQPKFHHSDIVSRDYVAVLFLFLCLSAIWTEITGVHAFFGAFAFGIIVPKDPLIIHDLAPKIELLIVEFFLPLYFAKSGLRTDLGALNTGEVWGIAFALVALATIGKLLPVAILARYTSKWFGMPMEADENEREEALARAKLAEQQILKDIRSSVIVTIPETNGKEIELISPTLSPGAESTAALRKSKLENISSESAFDQENNGHAVPMKMNDNDPEEGIGAEVEQPTAVVEAHAPPGMDLGNPNIVFKYEYLDWRTCFTLGLMMNTRGLVALIALNIGRDNNILGPKIFTMLVLMALITTFITSPLLARYYVLPMREEEEERARKRRLRNREASRAYGQDAMITAQLEAEEDEIRRLRQEEAERAAEMAQNRLSISIRPDSSLRPPHGSLHQHTPSFTSGQLLRAHTAHLPYQPPKHNGPVKQLSSLYEPPPRKNSYGLQSSTTDNNSEVDDPKYYQNTIRSSAAPQSDNDAPKTPPAESKAGEVDHNLLSPSSLNIDRPYTLQTMDSVNGNVDTNEEPKPSPSSQARHIRFHGNAHGEDEHSVMSPQNGIASE